MELKYLLLSRILTGELLILCFVEAVPLHPLVVEVLTAASKHTYYVTVGIDLSPSAELTLSPPLLVEFCLWVELIVEHHL